MKYKWFSFMHGSSSAKQFVGGAGAAFLISTGGKGISYFVQVVLARLLGVEGYGVYIYVLTIVTMLSIFSTMGFDSVLLKYLSMYRSRKEWALFNGMLRRSFQIPLGLSFLIALVVFVVANSVDQVAENHALYSTLLVGAFSLPLFTFLKILQSVFRSQKQITLSLLPNELLLPFFIVTGVAAYSMFLGLQLNSTGVLAYHAVVVASIFMFFSIVCYRQLSQLPLFSTQPLYKTGEWSWTASSLLLVSGMHIILSQTDIMLLGIFKGTTDAGVYAIASKIAVLVTFGLQIGNQILAPMISEMYHEGDSEKLQEVVSLGALTSAIFAVVVVLVIVVFADRLLLLFGSEFADGKTALFILAGGQMVNALMGPVGFIMTMTRHHRAASVIISVSALVNIVLNIILIPKYGMVGAAIATTVTMLSWNIVFWFYIRKNIGINTLVTSFFVRTANDRT